MQNSVNWLKVFGFTKVFSVVFLSLFGDQTEKSKFFYICMLILLIILKYIIYFAFKSIKELSLSLTQPLGTNEKK